MDEDAQTRAAIRPAEPVLGLRILVHPDLTRVGALCAPFAGELSRREPAFGDDALATLHVSRTPVQLAPHAGGVRVQAPLHAKLTLEGEPLVGERTLSADTLDEGLVLTLGSAVALWLGRFAQGAAPQLAGFVGVSAQAAALKRRLAQLAPQRSSVLLLGAPGSGKRTAARVLRELAEPFAVEHVAELCELTDAQQAALRERLARGERVIAGCAHEPATPLSACFAEVLQVPPLRERPEDVAPLFVHFVCEALSRLGADGRIRARDHEPPFVPAALIAGLVRAPWPDGARQLRAFADAYVLANHAQPQIDAAPWLAALSAERGAPSAQDLRRALAATGHDLARTAARLGMTRRRLAQRMRDFGIP